MKSGLDHAKLLIEKADGDLATCEISLHHQGPPDVDIRYEIVAYEKGDLLEALATAQSLRATVESLIFPLPPH